MVLAAGIKPATQPVTEEIIMIEIIYGALLVIAALIFGSQ
jgi:hypothetical protein